MKTRAFRFWSIGAVSVLLLASAGYLLSQQKPASGAGKPGAGGKARGGGPISVSVGKVRRGDMPVYINALGTVTPVYTVTVTSRVVGQLMDVRYREGQIVQKGQILATIDPRPYQASVTQAQGQLQRDQASLKNALIDLDRYRSVLAQHAIPEQQVATQTAVVEQDQGTVKVDEGNLDAATVNLDYATIRAPISGRVGIRTVDPGNIVQANGGTAIATITQLQPITVIFTVAEDYIDQIAPQMRAGKKLVVSARDRSDLHQIAQGTLLTLDNQIDVTTGTVRARATFANRDYALFPNEFVNANLLVKTLMGVNLIPTAAVQRNGDVAFVYVLGADSSVKSRTIKIAAINGETAAVTGVAVGETLVTDGFDRLTDGAKVSVREGRTAGGNPNQNEPSADSTKANEANPETSGNARSTGNDESTAPAERTGQPNQGSTGRAQQGGANTTINPNTQGSATNVPKPHSKPHGSLSNNQGGSNQ